MRHDPVYRELDAAHRAYWETGANGTLRREQVRVLRRWCVFAKGAATTHPEIVRSVAQLVHRAMPRGDSEATESPGRTLGWIIDSGVADATGVAPPDTGDRPGWVCINAATLCAALLRQLGYPVRECNVYLAQGGSLDAGFRGGVYQQAALQVWFDAAWHWVDPYLGSFDAAVTRDDHSRYKVDVPCFWSGTTTPRSWRPAVPGSGWTPFGLAESTGRDLQERFFPKLTDARGQEVLAADPAAARVLRPGSDVDRRGGTTTSGVFIRTPSPGVTLALRDVRGRLVAAGRSQIPGALHIPRGAAMFGLDPRPVARTTPVLVRGERVRHVETVFFGTRSLLASWDEVGHHELVLLVDGPLGTRADLHQETTIGDHVVRLTGLPSTVVVAERPQVVPIEVVIDPLDAAFHAQFARLVRSGRATPQMYWPATDALRAVRS